MNLSDFIPTNEFSEVLQVMMLAVMELHEKSPVVANTGFLSLTCSIPLKILLNHFLAIKHADNELVKAKLEARVKVQNTKLASGRSD